MKPRTVLLGAALLATVLAAYRAPPPQAEVVSPVTRQAVRTASETGVGVHKQGVGIAEVLRIRPRDGEADNLSSAFAAPSWVDRPAPPAPAVIASAYVPPPPTAPPLPFKVLGMYLDDGRQAVFLQFNDQNLVVREGDTIVNLYKVESLDDKVLKLVHLPTNQQQTINVGLPR
jgi:hypothetical protein